MHYWLSRPADLPQRNEQGVEISMLAYWKQQGDSLLRRVAIRTGGLMISQCATERANKIPKEIWSPERRSVSITHMMRDVFIHTNRDKYPHPKFDWSKEAHF